MLSVATTPGASDGSVSHINEPSSEMSNASAEPIVAAGWPPPMPRRFVTSIGDWPCLALMMISVELISPSLFSSLDDQPQRLIDEIEFAGQALTRRTQYIRYSRR